MEKISYCRVKTFIKQNFFVVKFDILALRHFLLDVFAI